MLGLTDFVLANLPQRPARVLEVGCGNGDLARALAASGYDVTAIDPVAPTGPIFRRIKLEDVEEDARFDAVVASRSFHHMANLEQNLDRIVELLDGGPFVLEEFAWERLDQPTADWYERQRRVLRTALDDRRPPTAAEWLDHHADVHRSEALLTALRSRFDELHFSRVPYLWRYLGGPATVELEESLIESGAIQALGFRFVGIPLRPTPLNRE